MQTSVDPLVVAQMALAAGADIAFSVMVGCLLLGLRCTAHLLVVRIALAVWLVFHGFYLPVQASLMADVPLSGALRVAPLVIVHSHFGLVWAIGGAAGIAALVATFAVRPARAGLLAASATVIAFTHAASTHAADAGDFSVVELVHTVHLLATAGWAGVVIAAAWPLRRSLTATPHAAAHIRQLSRVATWTFLLAIGTGLANAFRGLGGSLAPLTGSLWGQLLAAKVLVVLVVVVTGSINRFVFMKRVCADDLHALPAFMRLLQGEALLMAVALIAAAVLGHSIPSVAG
jgi:putative copper resistance protein D